MPWLSLPAAVECLQVDPFNERYPDTWFLIESIWNWIFIFELLWNMWGCFYVTQWGGNLFSSTWNLFDLFVVGISIPMMIGADIGSASQLRMFRAFRVFRLFKRIPSLQKIIKTIARAIPGMFNAAMVMVRPLSLASP